MRLISRVASSEWPPSSKKLSSMPTRSSPSTSANKPHSSSSCGRARRTRHPGGRELRRRQRAPVELAVGRQRKPIQHHEGRRNHVVRKAVAQMRAQRCGIGDRTRRRHHIGHQPLVAGLILARDHRRLRNRRMPRQSRLDLARLDPEAAELHLRVRTPEEVQNPVRAPARQVPGPVHPAPRSTKRVGHEPLRRQTRTTQIAARQTRARNVKLARDPSRHRLQAAVQHISPRVPDRTADRQERPHRPAARSWSRTPSSRSAHRR